VSDKPAIVVFGATGYTGLVAEALVRRGIRPILAARSAEKLDRMSQRGFRSRNPMSVQRVAITGGARGIGRATAEACLRAGMSVVIGDVDGSACAAVAAELGARAIGLPLDVRDPDSFEAFLAEAEERIGPLDVLVNNAGVAPIGPYIDEDPRVTQRTLDINIGGVLTGTRLALRRFLPRGHGHIVNMASSAGQIATAGGATYAATKHAVVGFTRAIRAETRGTGVRTTIVMPGIIRTDMTSGFELPRGTRVVGPEAVADAIVGALRSGREEVFVPRELGPIARLITGTPPAIADRLKTLLKADAVMTQGDQSARAAYTQRVDNEMKEAVR
jgi:NADP-dependent 3-hydroxy acid dehydrogenase YdfG